MNSSVSKASDVWKRIKPFAMPDLVSLLPSTKSGGSTSEGYAIMVYDQSAKKIKQYSMTSDGLSAAIAAAGSGDIIYLLAGTIGSNHTIPDGVSLVGMDRKRCVLTGQITVGDSSLLAEVSVTRSGTGELKGVVMTGTYSRVADCLISVTSSDDDAYGVYASGGAVGYVDGCEIEATGDGDGYAHYASGATLTVRDGSAEGSTAPIGDD